ncbi:MAG TPA: hypothetical protein VHZ07_19475 [Bryobacteraceae bacterium]|nr:hypothetical protein [Bryobacteraceae bacterium]
MSESEQSCAYGEWPLQPGPLAVRYPISLLHEIDFTVKDAARRISHGGMETGGFLFGRTSTADRRETVQIEAFRAIDCEHAFGPSFVLSERDLTKMREQLLQSGSDPALEGMRLLGWYIGHARNPLRLSDHEASLFERLFPRPGQLTLLVKPERFAPSKVSFIVRGQDRKADRDGTKIAFTLPPLSTPAPQPVIEEKPEVAPVPADSATGLPEALELGAPLSEPSKPQVEPAAEAETIRPIDVDPFDVTLDSKPAGPLKAIVEALKLEALSLEETGPVATEPDETAPVAEVIEAQTVRDETPAAEESKEPSEADPEPAQISGLALSSEPEHPVREIVPSGDFLSLEDLRARRLQRIERSERSERPERFEDSEERIPPRPPTFALMQQRPPAEVWKPLTILLAVLVLCGGAFWFHQQYFAPPVPLIVDDAVDKLMVSWPPDATRGGNDASIQVNGGAPIQLSMEEKVLGRTEIKATGDDVLVQLVVHHWYGNERGRARFVKPVITTLP